MADVRVRIRLDTRSFENDLKRLSNRADDIRVKVLLDDDAAKSALRRLGSNRETVRVRVEADTTRARAAISALGTGSRANVGVDLNLAAARAQLAALDAGEGIDVDVDLNLAGARAQLSALDAGEGIDVDVDLNLAGARAQLSALDAGEGIDVDVDLNLAGARAQLAALDVGEDLTIGVDANTALAAAKIAALSVGEDLTVSVDANTALAAAKIGALSVGEDLTIGVDANTALASAKIGALSVGEDLTIGVDANTALASAKIAALDVGEDLTIGVDANTALASAKIAALSVTSDISVSVDANTALASAKISALDVGDGVTVPVDANTALASAKIAALDVGEDLTVSVDANTALASAKIAALDVGDGITVPVDADVSAARSAIRGLASETVTVDVRTGAAPSVGGGGGPQVASGGSGGGSSRVGSPVLTGAVAGGVAAGVDVGTEVAIEGAQAAIAETLNTFSTAISFDQSVTDAAAIAGVDLSTDTGQAVKDELKGFFLELGADTALKVSPQEAATAFQVLNTLGSSISTIQGVDAQDPEGQLRGAIQLQNTIGGSIDTSAALLSRATSLAVQAGEDIPQEQVIQRVAGLRQSTQFGPRDILNLFAQGGTTAVSRGVEFDEFFDLAVVAANATAKGSDAGTAIKALTSFIDKDSNPAVDAFTEAGIIQRDPILGAQFLSDQFGVELAEATVGNVEGAFNDIAFSEAIARGLDPTSKSFQKFTQERQQELQDEAGFNRNLLFDREGNFAGVDNLINLFQSQLGGLSDKALGDILDPTLGSDAGRIGAAIVDLDRERFAEQQGILRSTDPAAIAASRNESAQGRIEAIQDQADTARIQLADASLDPLASFFGEVADFGGEVSPLISEAGDSVSESLTPRLEAVSSFLGQVGAFAVESGSIGEGLDLAVEDVFPKVGNLLNSIGELSTSTSELFSNAAVSDPGDLGGGTSFLDEITTTLAAVDSIVQATNSITESIGSADEITDTNALFGGIGEFFAGLGELSQLELIEGGLADNLITGIAGIDDALSGAFDNLGLNLATSIGGFTDIIGAENPFQPFLDNQEAQAQLERDTLAELGLDPDNIFDRPEVRDPFAPAGPQTADGAFPAVADNPTVILNNAEVADATAIPAFGQIPDLTSDIATPSLAPTFVPSLDPTGFSPSLLPSQAGSQEPVPVTISGGEFGPEPSPITEADPFLPFSPFTQPTPLAPEPAPQPQLGPLASQEPIPVTISGSTIGDDPTTSATPLTPDSFLPFSPFTQPTPLLPTPVEPAPQPQFGPVASQEPIPVTISGSIFGADPTTSAEPLSSAPFLPFSPFTQPTPLLSAPVEPAPQPQFGPVASQEPIPVTISGSIFGADPTAAPAPLASFVQPSQAAPLLSTPVAPEPAPQPLIPVLEPIEPVPAPQPLFPVLESIEPQPGVANMSIGEVEPIPDQEASANISWIIPPIPEQTVNVRVNISRSTVDVGSSGAAATPGSGPAIAQNASGTNFFPGGTTMVSEQGDELIIEPPPSNRRYVAIGEQVLDLPRGTRIVDANTTSRLLGISRRKTLAEAAFNDELLRTQEEIDRQEEEEERRFTTATSPSGGISLPSAPASAFAGFFRDGGDYIGRGVGLAGEVGPELFIGKSGAAAMLGTRGPEFFSGEPGRIYDHSTTNRMMDGATDLSTVNNHNSTINQIMGGATEISRVQQLMMSPPTTTQYHYNHMSSSTDMSQDNSRQIVVGEGGALVQVQARNYDGQSMIRDAGWMLRNGGW